MASFDYNYDTKTLTVESPDVSISVQELVNSIATEMTATLAMDDSKIAEWGGKKPLGQPGEFTGITLVLLNGWKLWFQEFDSGPAECIVTGGNILAKEVDGTSATAPVAGGVNVAIIAQASSATFSEAQTNKQMQYQIESLQKENYRQTGDTYYVDPINGDNMFDGLLPEQPSVGSSRGPKKTFAAAWTLVQSGHHDGVYFVQPNVGAATVLNENITIDKEDVQIRGPGPNFILRSVSAVTAPIIITTNGSHAELSGFTIEPPVGGGLACVDCSGSEPYLHHLMIQDGNSEGIILHVTADHFIIDKCTIRNCASRGVSIEAAHDGRISGGRIHDCNYGIYFDPLGGSVSSNNVVEDILIYSNVLKGVRVDSGFEDVLIRTSTLWHNNGTGQVGGADPDHDIENNDVTTFISTRNVDVERKAALAVALAASK